MTILCENKTRCSACGKESEFTGVVSTNTLGSPDLDLRPAEMQRSTMLAWVQRCPECGYCADDVSEQSLGFETVMASGAYQRQLNDGAYPQLANSFLCKARIDQNRGDHASAIWAVIHAAWACDDSRRLEQAVVCRKKAADMIVHAEAQYELRLSTDEPEATMVVLVDLLRRSGNMDEASKVIASRRATLKADVVIRILDFQAVLIGRGNMAAHTVSEALGESNDRI